MITLRRRRAEKLKREVERKKEEEKREAEELMRLADERCDAISKSTGMLRLRAACRAFEWAGACTGMLRAMSYHSASVALVRTLPDFRVINAPFALSISTPCGIVLLLYPICVF